VEVTAIFALSGLKPTPSDVLGGSVAGLVYLVPKPELLQGYAVINGVVLWATAIAEPLGIKSTPFPVLAGNVAGLAYLVPNPELDQGYAVTNGDVSCPTATAELSGLKEILLPVPVGSVAGLAYFGSDIFGAVNNGIFFSGNNSYNAGIYGRNSGSDLVLQGGGSERMRITSGGNVLMNTTVAPTTGGFTNTTLSVKQIADGLFGGGLQIEEAATESVAYFGFTGSAFNI